MAAFDGTRPQAPNLPDPEQLHPPAAPGDTFTGAARPIQDERLASLASSLTAFNSDLNNFGRNYSVSQRYHRDTSETAAARQYVSTRTPEEFAADAKAGKLPQFATPQAQTYMGVTEGTYAADSLGKEVQEKVGTGELKWIDGSAQNYMQQRRNEILQQNGWAQDSFQARGFGEHFNTLWQAAGKQGVNSVVTAENDRLKQAATTNIESAIDAAQKQGLDPAATWQKIDEARRTAIQYGHFEAKELDPMIFQSLNMRMAKDPNWVMGVGNMPRTDINDAAKTIPPLFQKAEYLSQAAQMEQRRQTFNVNAEDQKQKQAVTDGVAQIFNGPNPEALHNVPAQVSYVNAVSGAQGSISKPEAVKAAVNARISADNQRVAAGQATPEQVLDEQLNAFARAGERQQVWSDTLNGAAHGASAASLTDPRQQAQATAAFQLYANLRAKNPAYLDTLLDGNAKRFLSTAYIQRTLFDKSPVEAMQSAAAIWATPKSEEESASLAAHREAVASAARSLNWGGWFDPSIKNPQLARDAISDAAWSMVRLNGMTPEDAVKAAAPIVNAHFVNVNGSLVPSLGYLPKDMMQPAAERYLKDWATGPAAALHEDPRNLSIMPVGTGQFVVTHADSGLPLVTGRGMNYVTAKDLIETAKTITAEQAADRAKAVDAAASRAAGAIPGNVSDALHPGAIERRQRPREFMGDSFTPRLPELGR
jgi:hypothetical protein